jgi:chaperonin GroEL
MGKIIEIGSSAQEKIIKGVEKTANAIKTTLGPSGHCVAIEGVMGMPPEVTRDGATVAKSIKLSDGSENIGAELIKKAATLTEELAGDSTSTTAVLIKELCLSGQKYLKKGVNINSLKSGMQKACNWIVDYLKENTIKVDGDLEKIRKVATISANNDPEIGNLIVECFEKVGFDGVITADLTNGIETVIDVTSGMKLERGWASPQYITQMDEGTCVLENPYIAILGERISSVNQIIPVLEIVQKSGRPILFIVDEMDDIVNTTLVMNTLRGAIRACVIKGVDFGDNRKNTMADIAVLTGGAYVCQETGNKLSEFAEEMLGSAKKVVVSRDNTIIFEGSGDQDKIKERVDLIKTRMKSENITKYDLAKWEKRIANLSGGIGIIKAAGATETEAVNKKQTIEDAILASKSAIQEGCSVGGGYTYVKAEMALRKDANFWKNLNMDEIYGAEIVLTSVPVIMKTIAENAGESGDVVLNTVRKHKKEYWGFNAKTKTYEDLLNAGVLDSTKALRVSLENAVSTAAMILLIDCSLLEENEEDKKLH